MTYRTPTGDQDMPHRIPTLYYDARPCPPRDCESDLLDCIYSIPDPLKSWEEWQTFEHRDLSEMDEAELELERRRLTLRLELDRDVIPWLLERLRATRHAIPRFRLCG